MVDDTKCILLMLYKNNLGTYIKYTKIEITALG